MSDVKVQVFLQPQNDLLDGTEPISTCICHLLKIVSEILIPYKHLVKEKDQRRNPLH